MLLRSIPKLTLPLLVVYLVSNFLVDISPVVKAFAYVLSIPCSLVVILVWRSWTLSQEMDRLGAQEMPMWEGKWPGSIDLLMELYSHWIVRNSVNRNDMKPAEYLIL